MRTVKPPSADNRPARRRVTSGAMPPSPRQRAGRRSEANADQVKPAEPVTVPTMRFKATLRRIDTGETISLSGFIRLTAIGSEQVQELGRMPAGSMVTWAGACWEVQP